MADDIKYYIQDTRPAIGNYALWWKTDGNGYTTDLAQAGIFSQMEAESIERRRITDKKWSVAIIQQLAKYQVALEDLN